MTITQPVPVWIALAHPPSGRGLMYNEYIVYDTSQIKMRYALKIKFNHAY